MQKESQAQVQKSPNEAQVELDLSEGCRSYVTKTKVRKHKWMLQARENSI